MTCYKPGESEGRIVKIAITSSNDEWWRGESFWQNMLSPTEQGTGQINSLYLTLRTAHLKRNDMLVSKPLINYCRLCSTQNADIACFLSHRHALTTPFL